MNMKTQLFIYACLVLFCFGGSIAFAEKQKDLTDKINAVRFSVVEVGVEVDHNSISKIPIKYKPYFQGCCRLIVGTGFFVNSHGDIVTAYHVVDGFTDQNGEHPGIKQIIDDLVLHGVQAYMFIGVPWPNVETAHISIASGVETFPAQIYQTCPQHDLALIKPINNPFTNIRQLPIKPPKGETLPKVTVQFVRISTVRPQDAQSIYACGYPFAEPGLVTTSGNIASAWKYKVLVRAAADGYQIFTDTFEVDLRINPGNSGGPVFSLRDDVLIGVSVESHGSLGIVVPSKYVTEFLNANKIPWNPSK